MDHDHLRAWLALHFCSQIKRQTALTLLTEFPSYTALCRARPQSLAYLGIPTLHNQLKQLNQKQFDKTFSWMEAKPNRWILPFASDNYPPQLKEIASPPLLLYGEGNPELLHQNQLAIVGTRIPSPQGNLMAHQFANELACSGWVITSGLAIGIDGQAHKGALSASGKTLAVMATGLDQIYPYRHRELAETIKQDGLILSEFPLGSPPIKTHFPQRNRLISGLSLGVIIIEANLKSGSLITAQFALEQNRDVFALPGAINNPMSSGCHHLIRQGAILVRSTEDVIQEYSHLEQKKSKKSATKALIPLDNDLLKLVKFVDYSTTPLDIIAERSSLPMSTLLCQLFDLEAAGAIYAVAGGYVRTNP